MSFDFYFFANAFIAIAHAIPVTLSITVFAFVTGCAIGTATASIRVRRIPILSSMVEVYVSVIRGTPALLHMMIVSLAVPSLLDATARGFGVDFQSNHLPLAAFVALALSITAGSYLTEIIRAGTLAVPQSQVEAGLSLGMSHWQLMRRIVLPQALAISLPSLCNVFIALLHGSSLAYLVSVKEMTGTAVVIASREWKYLECYTAIALIYWAFTVAIGRFTAVLERRWTARINGAIA